MTNHPAAGPAFEVNRRLLVGGVALMGAGGLLWVAGATATSAALSVAVRRWVRQWETSPSERARQRWAQLRAVSAAGTDAWRQSGDHGVPGQREHVTASAAPGAERL
jgi:hypothetical protein